MEEAVAKEADMASKLADERAKIKDLMETREELATKVADAKKSTTQATKRAEKAKAAFAACEKRDIETREKLKSLRAQQKKAKTGADKEAKKLVEHKAAQQRNEATAAELKGEAQQHVHRIAEAEAEVARVYETIADEVAPLREELAALQSDRAPLAEAMAAAESAGKVLGAERALLEGKANAGAARAARAAEALERAQASVVSAKTAIELAQDKAAARAAEAAEARAAREEAARDYKACDEAQTLAIAKLEDYRASLAASRGQSQVIDALLGAAAEGTLAGVHGRLGGLGSIDKKYDVAVSTACAALDHVVVDSTDAAQACVDFLRARKLGVATFLILEKLQHLAAKAAAPFPPREGAQRLYDLVQPVDPKFGPAFYHALGDTLVCATLDSATAIAFQQSPRLRTVSLEGHVVDASGTMSGGGNRQLKGRLRKGAGSKGALTAAGDAGDGASSQPELEKAVDHARAARAEARARLDAGHAAEAAAAQRVKEAALDVKKAEATLRSTKAQEADAQKQHAAATKEGSRSRSDLTADEAARLEALADEEAANAKALTAARADLAQSDVQIAAVQQRLDSAGGTAFKAKKATLASAQAALDAAKVGAAKAALEAEAERKAAVKSDTAVAKLRAEAERLAEDLENATAALAQIEAEGEEAMDKCRVAEEEAAEVCHGVDTARDELAGLDESLAKVRSVEVDVAHQVDELKRSVKDNTQKQQQWESKLEGLRAAAADTAAEYGPELVRRTVPTDGDGDEGPADGVAPEMPIGRLVDLSDAEAAEVDTRALAKDIAAAEEALTRMEPNMAAIADFKSKEAAWHARLSEFDETCGRRDQARAKLEGLKKARLEEFMAGFTAISLKLKEMYQMITLGGDAELELVDSLDPFSEVWRPRGQRTLALAHAPPRLRREWSSPCGRRESRGRTSPTSPAARRRSRAWPSSSPSTTTSPRRSTSWTRSTPPLTSRTCPSWPTTSRSARATLNSSSSPSGTTCLSLRTALLVRAFRSERSAGAEASCHPMLRPRRDLQDPQLHQVDHRQPIYLCARLFWGRCSRGEWGERPRRHEPIRERCMTHLLIGREYQAWAAQSAPGSPEVIAARWSAGPGRA